MTSRPPPPPAEQRAPRGDAPRPRKKSGAIAGADKRQRNVAKQGRQGNIRQNTRNPGYQQDR